VTGNLRDELQTSLGAAYTLEQELGGGGMSRVFVAMETKLRRRVVVKVLSPELTSGLSTGRFEREIGLAASLQQANIVPVLSSGDVNGLPFYTMPFIEGRSLRARLSEGPVPISEVVSILKDVARALAYAHERSVVHRDIKPDNVLISGGTAVVTDFGIAKAISASMTVADGHDASGTLTQLGTTLGTPAYMAPEQAAGDPSADHRADLYAFGCLAYELLAGHPPFQGLTPQKLFAAHMSERPRSVHDVRLDTPVALDALVMQCLEKEADQRPQRAVDVTRVLESITSGSATTMPATLLGRETSLGKGLVIWAAAFGATYVLAKAAIVGIGLPNWVLPWAMGVAALGLPAVLATHYVQRTARRAALTTPTLTHGGSTLPPSAMGTFALRASPHLTWTRTWRAGALAGLAFVLLVTGFMTLRALGIGPAGSLFAKGVIGKNDRVVLARFATSGADSSLANVLTEALRADLVQSRVLSVLQPSAVREALARMQRPVDSPLDADLAREVAQRDGAKLVIAADVAPLGAGFVVTARLLEPTRGDPVASITETARSAEELIAAVGRVSRQIRGKIGESLRSVQNTPPLERVTTASLEAFRKYDEAIQLTEGLNGNASRGYSLLLEAIKLDTTFAMAYRKLGWVELNPAKQQEYLAKAFRFRDRLSDVERLQAEGLYYWLAAGDLDRAIDLHLEAAHIDSTIPRVTGNLAQLYFLKREYEKSLEWAKRAGVADSLQYSGYAIPALVALRRFDEVRGLLRRDSLMAGSNVDFGATQNRLTIEWAQERWDSVASIVRTTRTSGSPDGQLMAFMQLIEMQLATLRGHLLEVEAKSAALFAAARAAGVPLMPIHEVVERIDTDVWYREKMESIAILDSVVAKTPFDSMPVENRPYLPLAILYAKARRADGARAMIARYDSDVRDSLHRRRDVSAYSMALGWLAIADNRPADAVVQFRRSLDGLHPCPSCGQAALGLAHDLAGQRDTAIAVFQTYLDTPDAWSGGIADPVWRALVYRRLGDLYEQKGDTGKAVANYSRFVDLWATADPDLQPKVAEVRAKLKKLAYKER
jgi:eukaryotic-like serine/threonine-protein kinase